MSLSCAAVRSMSSPAVSEPDRNGSISALGLTTVSQWYTDDPTRSAFGA